MRRLLDSVVEYLEYQKETGVAALEVSRDAVKALGEALVAPASSLTLEQIAGSVGSCARCVLHSTYLNTGEVPHRQGNAHPEILFVGEAPGADEDRQGLAFVGAAGQLLTRMIEAMGFTREQVFIANVVKCRPPENRPPLPEEMEQCLPYLKAQIARLQPKVIVALGAVAARGLLGLSGITRLRGKWFSFGDIPVMPTYHPSYLLRTPSAKKDCWLDLQEVLKRLGRQPAPRAKPAPGPAPTDAPPV